jgi:transcriptional regulator with XRE-family HTH domain
MRKQTRQPLSPLSQAVRSTRESYGDTQEQFAHRVGVVLMSISRFETGKAEPRDPRVLRRLADVARDKGLREAEELFRQPLKDTEVHGENYLFEMPRSLAHWRYLAALRLAMTQSAGSQPVLPALEKALAAPLEIVDEVLMTTNTPGPVNYRDLDFHLKKLAERKELEQFQKKDTRR